MFGAFAATIENQIPGYTGRDAKHKPEILKRLIDREQLLTLDQYRAVMAGLFAAWNHTHPVGSRDHPPMHYYADHQPTIPDPAQLDTLLLRPAGTRILHNHGFDIAGLGRFMSEDPEFILRIGHKFVIRYTRDDTSAIVAICPRTAERWRVPRAAADLDPDPWAMLFGRPAGPAHKQAQAVRSTQRRAISQAGRAVHATLDPQLADPTGGWHIASANVTRRQLRIPDQLPQPEPPPQPATRNPQPASPSAPYSIHDLLDGDRRDRALRQAAVDAIMEPADATD